MSVPNIILCAGAPNPAIHKISKVIKSLPKDSEIILIGVDRGALRLIDSGYQLDIAIGDFDSVTDKEFSKIEKFSDVVNRVSSEKDLTDTELAFHWIYENYPHANLYVFGSIGEGKGRLDHLISNLYLIYQPELENLLHHTQIIESYLEITWFGPGNHVIEVGNILPDYLSIITLTEVKKLSIENAKYNLPPTDYKRPMAFISNEFIDLNSNVKLSLVEGQVMVMKINESNVEL